MNKAFALAAWLALLLALLLFAQWPLREFLGAFSREANDLGQIIFALYAAVAVSAASKAKTHLAAHAGTDHATKNSDKKLAWRRWALALCVLPWAGFVLFAGAGSIWQSVMGLEKFPDTFHPGYFLIKFAGGLLCLLIIVDALQSLLSKDADER